MFDDNIYLFDPIVKKIEGKHNVLEVNREIFKSCKEIKFLKKEYIIDSNKMTVAGKVEFFCDNQRINVVDIITFNSNLKIISIVAYLDTKELV